MISTLFSNPIFFISSLISIVIAISVHEFAHAKIADQLGDPTPGLQGRLTLNPKAHIDLYGMIFLLLIGFGWGKPVQFDPFNLKHPRRDAALISIAGPLSNFAIALIMSILLRLLNIFDLQFVDIIGLTILIPMIYMNIVLGVFNLLPIHPLDGFKIVGGWLSDEQAKEWHKLERYGMIFLLVLILPFGSKPMLRTILDPVLSFMYTIFIPNFGSKFI